MGKCATRLISGFVAHVVSYMRVSTADERQSVDLQRDALVAAGVDARHLHQDRSSGAKDHRPGLQACLAICARATCWWSGSSTAWGARCTLA